MNRAEVIRTLYIGGQAAIIAELVAVVGIFVFVLLNPNLMEMMQQNGDGYQAVQEAVNFFNKNSFSYILALVLILIIPTMAMLAVVWAWHLYFTAEGVHLMNWVATTVAIAGATLVLASFGISTLGFDLVTQALEQGHIEMPELFIGFAIGEGIQRVGIIALYVMYPIFLSLASWQKRLLPRWFIALSVFFALVNDLHLLFNMNAVIISALAQVAQVLSPFIMGVVMLNKAQQLALRLSQDLHTPATQF